MVSSDEDDFHRQCSAHTGSCDYQSKEITKVYL